MKEIAVDEIGDGQVLAGDVVCPETGQVLLAAGVELKRSHAELLARRGVLTVRIVSAGAGVGAGVGAGIEEPPPVASSGEPGEAEAARDEFADALSRLEHMFEGLDDDPIMRALHSVARGMVQSARKGEDGK